MLTTSDTTTRSTRFCCHSCMARGTKMAITGDRASDSTGPTKAETSACTGATVFTTTVSHWRFCRSNVAWTDVLCRLTCDWAMPRAIQVPALQFIWIQMGISLPVLQPFQMILLDLSFLVSAVCNT